MSGVVFLLGIGEGGRMEGGGVLELTMESKWAGLMISSLCVL